jgi:hypothetical protein
LHKFIPPNPWERETGIIQLPGVHIDLWIFALSFKRIVDFNGVVVVLHIESP